MRPSGRIIKPKQRDVSEIEQNVAIQNSNKNVELENHIKDTIAHISKDERDNLSVFTDNTINHLEDTDIHVSSRDRAKWNNMASRKEAKSYADNVETALRTHTNNTSIHITQKEKDNFNDKYTKAEIRNLLRSMFDINIDNLNPNQIIKLIQEATATNDGLMSKEDKKKLDNIEANSNYYIHPDDVTTRHVTDIQINSWDNKADSTPATAFNNGLMSFEDKKKLDTISTSANNYIHPECHPATMITEDNTHKFVTENQINEWTAKETVEHSKQNLDKAILESKSYTNSRISALMNATDDQLDTLKLLSFELKNDNVVKAFFDKFNECASAENLKEHVMDSNVHLTPDDKLKIKTLLDAITNKVNPDFEEEDQSSLAYIKNKPKSLKANGGNSDTVGNYTPEQLTVNKSISDIVIGTYTNDTVLSAHVLIDETEDCSDKLQSIFDNLEEGQHVTFKTGNYILNKPVVINAKYNTITSYGKANFINKGFIVKGFNNRISNLLFDGSKSAFDTTAIKFEGNNNIIDGINIKLHGDGIQMINGSYNRIINCDISNIKNSAIQLNSENNSSRMNRVEYNNIKDVNKGVALIGDKKLSFNTINNNFIEYADTGVYLSSIKVNDFNTTTNNIVNQNIIIRGNNLPSDFTLSQQTIYSEFASNNIFNDNILGKEIKILHK